LNSITINHDFLILANNLCQRVVVKMINRNVDGARNMASIFDESPVDDSDRMPDIPVDEIFKTSIGAIYQVNDQLTIHGNVIAEFLGDGKIEQLGSINGHKIGDSLKMDTDATVYVVGLSFGYKF
jgi:long-subunit fatty acid transport protein